jgi:pilus assembly protein CpaF
MMYLEIGKTDGPSQTRELRSGIYSIGSDLENQIVLAGSKVAGRHAILCLRPGSCWIEALTLGGTLLGGEIVRGRAEVLEGQVIGIEGYRLKLFQEKPEAAQPVLVAKEAAVTLPKGALSGPSPIEPGLKTAAVKPERAGRDERLMALKQTIKQQILKELLERLDIKRLTASQIEEGELHQRVLSTLEGIVNDVGPRLPLAIPAQVLIKELYDEAVGLGPLEDLLADPTVTEIMVNGPSRVYVERQGKIELSEKTFLDDKSVLAVIERIVSPLGRRIDESQPYVDARLRDGSRVNAVIHPLSLTGPCITIRKFSKVPLTDEDLIRLGTWTAEIRDFLRAAVLARKNIVVSGGTGSGKTTLLNVLGGFLPETDRIITIEDAAELQLKQEHVVSLEARSPNIEGKGAISIRDLVRNSLRMRPDRILVGECRGGEALDMLQAMNTGHDGSLTTIHANSPRDTISRLETLVLMSGMDLPVRAIREQIASAVDVIVQESRFGDGSRKVVNVTEVVGLEGDRTTMQDIFVYEQKGIDADGKVVGKFTSTGSVPTFLESMRARGVKVDQKIFDPQR